MKTIVLCDGGFKSVFVAGLAVKECGSENVRLLLIDGGQKAVDRQRKAIDQLSDHYGVSYACLNYGFAGHGIFELTTYIFSALSYAHQIGFDKVYYGASKAPKGSSNFNYELTHTHLRNMQLMVRAARVENRSVKMPEPEAPCMLLNTQQIMMMSRSYNVPLDMTWNCETSNDVHCGKCIHCVQWVNACQTLIRGSKNPAHINIGRN